MRLLRQADFCFPDASVTDIRYDPDRNLNKDRITILATCDWIDDHRNVVITGATGAGKSWVACALGSLHAMPSTFCSMQMRRPAFVSAGLSSYADILLVFFILLAEEFPR